MHRLLVHLYRQCWRNEAARVWRGLQLHSGLTGLLDKAEYLALRIPVGRQRGYSNERLRCEPAWLIACEYGLRYIGCQEGKADRPGNDALVDTIT